jgi:hypothetical protein
VPLVENSWAGLIDSEFLLVRHRDLFMHLLSVSRLAKNFADVLLFLFVVVIVILGIACACWFGIGSILMVIIKF